MIALKRCIFRFCLPKTSLRTGNVVAIATVGGPHGPIARLRQGKTFVMHVAVRSLEVVLDSLTEALDDLDMHGQAMAALHLAMAIDCLRASMDVAFGEDFLVDEQPRLRLVASS